MNQLLPLMAMWTGLDGAVLREIRDSYSESQMPGVLTHIQKLKMIVSLKKILKSLLLRLGRRKGQRGDGSR